MFKFVLCINLRGKTKFHGNFSFSQFILSPDISIGLINDFFPYPQNYREYSSFVWGVAFLAR